MVGVPNSLPQRIRQHRRAAEKGRWAARLGERCLERKHNGGKTTETFNASVQYGDWKGTAAADRADQNDPDHWLEKSGKKNPDEFLGLSTKHRG